MYEKIDIKNWKRKSQYEFYKDFDLPFFNISAQVDVTNTVEYSKRNKVSFFLLCLYLSQKALGRIEEFRSRIQEDTVVIYDNIDAGSTILFDDNTFGFCYFDRFEKIDDFVKSGEQQILKAKAKKEFLPAEYRDDLIHYSVLPWISFTNVQHARKLSLKDSIPKIVFGKFYEERGLLKMPISVSGHHALMDGYHVGQYFSKLGSLMKCEFDLKSPE